MHCSVLDFAKRTLTRSEIKDKNILEVGSYNINGSLKQFIEQFGPNQYIGIDTEKGKDVDCICSADGIVDGFGKERFDMVISTETIEHVENWKGAIANIKNACKTGGIILITTRSRGYKYHAYPTDFWRYELEDIANIFSDCTIKKLERDIMSPGVLLKAQKPVDFVEKDLQDYEVYEMKYWLEY